MTDFQDKTLVCRDCGKEFVWTAGEQKFFEEKGFTNPPTRCPDDRKKNKEQRKSNRVKTNIICKKCGKEGQVPFQPKDPNDILCSDCFYEERAAQGGTHPATDKTKAKDDEAKDDAAEVKVDDTEAKDESVEVDDTKDDVKTDEADSAADSAESTDEE